MRIRLPFVPSIADRAALTVLLSHRSTEYARAQAFGCRLEKLGFSVKLLVPGELGQCSDEELRSKLYELTLTTDICCVMVSQDAAASEWVRLEYQEAAAIYGRIIFTFNNLPTGKFGFEQPSRYSNRPRMVGLQVRHTTIEENSPDDVLLVELCNSPDEGWIYGTEQYELNTNRRLKNESEIRKFVRASLQFDFRYSDKTIVDVVPFSWDDSPTRDKDEIFRWVLNTRGRDDLVRLLGRGEIDGFLARYLVPVDSQINRFLGKSDDGVAHALVFTLHSINQLSD